MSKRLSADEKVRIVLSFMRSSEPVIKLCQKSGIAETTYYYWRKLFIAGGTAALNPRTTLMDVQSPVEGRASEYNLAVRHLQKVAALRELRRERKPRPIERREIVALIDKAPMCKSTAIALSGVPRSSYYRWRKETLTPHSIATKPCKPRRIKLSKRHDVREAVFATLHSPPVEHGFNRATWRIGDLKSALQSSAINVSRHVIRAIIKDAGYRWRKAKVVLTSKDPDYRSKLDRIKNILARLGNDEGFFSIDEFGPFAIKCQPGRRLVAPGNIATVPQWQKSKGSLIVTAALELATNQLFIFIQRKKIRKN